MSSEAAVARDQLNALVRDSVQRTYLDAIEGFWANTIIHECAFLEGRGYAIKEIRFHQNGSWLRYRGPRGSIGFNFDPEAGYVTADAYLSGGLVSFEGDLNVLAQIYIPAHLPPPKSPLTEAVITERIQYWADALRAAPEIV
jgi:hypothetical protein